MSHNCHISDLGYVYPGQTLTLALYRTHSKLHNNSTVIIKTDIDLQYIKPCIVLNINEHSQIMDKPCTEMSYTIAFSLHNWCQIYLKILSDSDKQSKCIYCQKA